MQKISTPDQGKADMRSPEQATILCVEDEEPQLQLRKLLLESGGFHVLTAQSGRQALEVFRAHPVDAVILDYFMPGMNGLTIAREMKRLNPSVPIIIFSAYTSLPDEVIGTAEVWLRKAEIDPEELLAHVRRVLEQRPAH
jgi:CheY-like chemotaxis protein